jgi:hypothetical protein
MMTAGQNLSTVFRSLGADDSAFMARTKASALEAEQRWPLFRAVAPKKPEDTPLLTEQDRANWNTQEKPAGRERKKTLSVPGLSEKLAKSLEKISAETSREVMSPKRKTRSGISVAPARFDPTPEPAAVLAPEPQEIPSMLFRSTPPAPASFVTEQPAPVAHGLFGRLSVEEPVPTPAPLMPVETLSSGDDSLSGIFARIGGEKSVEAPPAVKPRSAFLGRLGKR